MRTLLRYLKRRLSYWGDCSPLIELCDQNSGEHYVINPNELTCISKEPTGNGYIYIFHFTGGSKIELTYKFAEGLLSLLRTSGILEYRLFSNKLGNLVVLCSSKDSEVIKFKEQLAGDLGNRV